MSSLEAALPSTQLTNDYFAGATQPWYPQNAATTFVSSLPEGKFKDGCFYCTIFFWCFHRPYSILLMFRGGARSTYAGTEHTLRVSCAYDFVIQTVVRIFFIMIMGTNICRNFIPQGHGASVDKNPFA